MRFLLYFPLPLLLILGTFVSIDSQAASQSVFKPVPWSTHKPRLKRSIDDSNSTADYDSLSLDQLTKLLEETKKTAENEKMQSDAAAEAYRVKKEEFDKATEDYEKKKTEWDKFKSFIEWTNESNEAQKIIQSINIPALEKIASTRETDFIFAKKTWEIAEDEVNDFNDLAEGKDVETRLNDESTSLTQEIAEQSQTEALLNQTKTEKDTALAALKNQEFSNNAVYNAVECGDPQKATVQPCPNTIANLDRIKDEMPIAEDEAATATQNHKVADDKKQELESKKTRISQRLVRIGEVKNDIKGGVAYAAQTLVSKTTAKDNAEKPFLEAKTALQTAKAALENAKATKTDADQKLTDNYPPDAATEESKANTAQDEAGRKKIELEGELASLKSDRDEKEKQLNATNAKIEELQRAETAKKSAVSTGGGSNPVTIIVPIVVVIILGIIGVAVFLYLKRRKRISKQAKASPNSGGAAAAPAPEAVDSQNPTVASQKPPSDPAAAPQPGSTKSNEAPPVADPAPPAPPAQAVNATPIPPPPPIDKKQLKAIEDRDKEELVDEQRRMPYMSALDPGYVEIEDLIEIVPDKEHQKELQDVAIPGTKVHRKDGSHVFNLENESGNINVSAYGRYLLFALDARKFHLVNGIDDENRMTDGQKVLFSPNPKGCPTINIDARNCAIVFKIDMDRPTEKETYADKETTKCRMDKWAAYKYYAQRNRKQDETNVGERAGAGQETDPEDQDFDEYMSTLSSEGKKQYMADAIQDHSEECGGCAYCALPRYVNPSYPAPPSLMGHYWHEATVWFNSVLNWFSSRFCLLNDDDDDDESCWSQMGDEELPMEEFEDSDSSEKTRDEMSDVEELGFDEEDGMFEDYDSCEPTQDEMSVVEKHDFEEEDGMFEDYDRCEPTQDEMSDVEEHDFEEEDGMADKKSDGSESTKDEQKKESTKDEQKKESTKDEQKKESTEDAQKEDGKQKQSEKKSDGSDSSKHEKKEDEQQKKASPKMGARLRAGGGGSNSEKKRKQRSDKREKEKHKTRRESKKEADKKSDGSESTKDEQKKESTKDEEKKDEMQKKSDKKSDGSVSSKHKKKIKKIFKKLQKSVAKNTNDSEPFRAKLRKSKAQQKEKKSSDKKSDGSGSKKNGKQKKKDEKQKKKDEKQKKKDEKQKKISQCDEYSPTSSTESTESDPRSPKPGWEKTHGKNAKCKGQRFTLWAQDKRPSLERLYVDKNGKRRLKMSKERCEEIIKRIAKGPEPGQKQLVYDSELILDICVSFLEAIKKDKKYLEIDEERKSVRIGDIHGCMDTIHSNFNNHGGVGSEEWLKARFIFTGDYVDRGKQSLDVVLYLFTLRILYPDNIVVLRGNHEIYSVNVCYGFYLECLDRIADREGSEKGDEGKDIHFYFNYVFAWMTIICRHNNTIQCHGGCSRTTVKKLRDMNKHMLPFMFEPSLCSPMANDLLWNDPKHGIKGFIWDNKRKAFCFGPDVVIEFMKAHPEIQLWVRGHQVMNNGAEFFAGKRMVSIFGTSYYDATGYNNHGSNLVVTENNDMYINHFKGIVLVCKYDEFKGPIMKFIAKRTVDQHNFYNMFPSIKAHRTVPVDAPSEMRRTIVRPGRSSREANNDPSETIRL